MVVGGNAISFQAPLQFGIAGYLPRARFTFQYDRQLSRAHWLHVGFALLADRGNYKTFKMDDCGMGDRVGVCDRGGVFGWDLYAGYSHKFYIRKRPYIVPIVRGSLGFSMFYLPRVGGGDGNREQSRTRSLTLNVRGGGGVRIFLLEELSIGMDLNLPLGFLVHRELPPAGKGRNKGEFLFGIEVLPLVVEYRF